MPYRVLIENPAPFKQARRGAQRQLADVPMDEGVETAMFYVEAGSHFSGFHHSDLDWYEAREMRGETPPQRYDSLDYARYVGSKLRNFNGILVPHRVIVYQPPEVHAQAFQKLVQAGIRDLVLVGKPFSTPPAGATYRNSVEQMLTFLRERTPELPLNLGVVVIHDRRGEVERLLRKIKAAGGRKLHLITQFLDAADPMLVFMDDLAAALDREAYSFDTLEWNVGLAMYTLQKRLFYAKLLRKNKLACEKRFADLQSLSARVEESVRMNLEFAGRIRERGKALGFDIGFSIQPIIERNPDGTIHAGLHGAVKLVRRLEQMYR